MGFFNSYRFPFARYPAVRLALCYIAGIIICKVAEPGSWVVGGLICCVLAVFTAERLNQDKASLSASRISTLCFITLVVLSGMWRYQQASALNLTPTEQLIRVSDWDSLIVKGRVLDVLSNSEGKTRLDLLVDSSSVAGIASKEQFRTRVLWNTKRKVELGDEILAKGIIIPVGKPRNPLAFNYADYLHRRGIYTQLRADSLLEQKSAERMVSWTFLRKKALLLIGKNFSDATAPLAKALLLGYKNDLEGKTRRDFARAGLSHIMAVSGLHVGLIIAPFWIIMPYFWSHKRGKVAGMAVILLVLTGYAGITGFSSSVVRASVMAVFLTYGKLFSRRSDSVNLTAAAAFLILLADPEQLFEIGFQLSFSAVLVILLILPVIQSRLPYWVRVKWYGAPLMVVIISVVVQLGLYPLQVWYFGEVSLISPVANALFVPFLGVIVPLAVAALAISALAPVAGRWINLPSEYFLQGMDVFVQWASGVEGAWIKASPGSPLIFLIWSMLILSIAGWRERRARWKLVCGLLAGVLLLEVSQLVQLFQNAEMEVVVFDVGQGDAALIRTPTGKVMLIDAGVWTPTGNSGQEVILPYLKSAGISRIDAVVLSHPHADHIGGIGSIMNEVKIGRIYDPGYEYDSGIYQEYLLKAEESGIPIIPVAAGDSIHIDPALLILVLGPQEGIRGADPNQHSVVLNMIYGESEFLFTGDAGKDQERRLVQNYGDLLDTDFLKVGHHGSRTSSGLSFLNKVTPEIAVMSLGASNRFRHPHKEAVARIGTSKAKLYFTSRDGGLIFRSDGATIRRHRWSGAK